MDVKEKKDPTGNEIEIEFLNPKGKSQKDEGKEIKKLENKLKKQHKEIAELEKNVKSLKDDFLRQVAEKDNLRKRLEKDKKDHYNFALGEILKEFLTILDNFERALNSRESNQEAEGFHEGIEMIYKHLRDLIFKQGVTPIEIENEEFDPHLHQAFLTEESDEVDEMRVSEELQKGYRLHDRLLRPSLVKVAIPKKKN